MDHDKEIKGKRSRKVNSRIRGVTRALLVYILSLFMTLPLFVIIYPYVPTLQLPIAGGFRVDHFITLIGLLLVCIAVVRQFEVYIYALSLIGILVLAFTSLTGRYGVTELYRDYATFLNSLRDKPVEVPFIAANAMPFANAAELVASADYRDEEVRNFAVRTATKHFHNAPVGQDEITLVQCFSVFKEINSRWRYVADPVDGEYFATAAESMVHFSGDCDDHAILMAACIKAIGGEVRFVRTTGHIYPELKIGSGEDVDRASTIIRRILFIREARGKELFHHTDEDGDHWINLDYTRNYPGGEFVEEEIIGIQEL